MAKTGNYYENFIEGLRIFEKYMDEDEKDRASFSAAHDIIYVGVEPFRVEEADQVRLEKLGFHKTPDYECWGWFT